MVKVQFKYKLDASCHGLEIDVEAEVGLEPKLKVPHIFWDTWKIDGKEILDTDLISDDDKSEIYQQIMDEYDDIIIVRKPHEI